MLIIVIVIIKNNNNLNKITIILRIILTIKIVTIRAKVLIYLDDVGREVVSLGEQSRGLLLEPTHAVVRPRGHDKGLAVNDLAREMKSRGGRTGEIHDSGGRAP